MTAARIPNAIVTGGAAGIGWDIALCLAADGYRVIAADLVPGFTADGLAGADGILWRELDVTAAGAADELFGAIAEEFDGIDVLVNNAGIQRHRALEDLTFDEWKSVVDVNLHGVFRCLQAAGRLMLAGRGGSIVNISSVAARGAAGRAPYASTKAAVIGLTATAGAEWASRGVRVNAVAPGYVDTGVLRHGIEAGTLDIDSVLARIPAGRLAQATEIADAVSFLVSSKASYMAGQTLFVDGGFLVDYGIRLARKPG